MDKALNFKFKGALAPFLLEVRIMGVEPLFLSPVFKQRIWGGTALRDRFNYDIPSDSTGECWAISAHANGTCFVQNGIYEGLTVRQLWSDHRHLFGNSEGDSFPLLTKILDANWDLSVQVHPDDSYAKQHENDLGKTECWYIIDCEENAEIIFGHTAKTKEEFAARIQNGEWGKLLRTIKIKPGDFFFVPSGTIHALGAGTLVLETQQSSDTTYRVYDYDRKDDKGNQRELHLDKAIDVVQIPHQDPVIERQVKDIGKNKIITYIQSPFFTVEKWEIRQAISLEQNHDFLLISVIEGEGEIISDTGTYKFQFGDHFILPFGFGRYRVEGNADFIVSFIES